jgi:hypothetical protein
MRLIHRNARSINAVLSSRSSEPKRNAKRPMLSGRMWCRRTTQLRGGKLEALDTTLREWMELDPRRVN